MSPERIKIPFELLLLLKGMFLPLFPPRALRADRAIRVVSTSSGDSLSRALLIKFTDGASKTMYTMNPRMMDRIQTEIVRHTWREEAEAKERIS